MRFPRKALLAVIAAGGVALAGAACSGGADGSGASAEGRAEAGSTSRASSARLVTAEFRVEGMTCGGCAMATEMAVEKLEGVESAEAEYLGEEESGRCTVTYDPSALGTSEIAAAIERAGYEPSLTGTSSGS